MGKGPNVRRLIAQRMSYLMVPKDGGLADALAAMVDRERLSEVARQATAEVEECIRVAKTARPNPHGDDDEAIAGAILAAIEAKKGR